MDNNEKDELKKIISDSVDESVEHAFKKYGGGGKKKGISLTGIIVVIVIVVLVAAARYFSSGLDRNTKKVSPVSSHDLTLENNGIFGYKAADFAEPILGKAEQKQLLIVEEKDASINTTLTEAGFLNFGIFSKSQVLIIHGKGEYTVDLSQMTEDDISLSDDYVLTIKVPHAELHTVTFDPDKTEVGDTDRGWLAFGEIKLTAEQNKTVESEAVSKLTESLSRSENMDEADRFAKLTVSEEFQKVVSSISPAYKVEIEFKNPNAEPENASGTSSISNSEQNTGSLQ